MAKKLSAFEQAFADARKEYLAGTGPKNFTFNGKLYNTNLAGESSKKTENTESNTSRQSVPPRAEFVGGVKSADQSSWDSPVTKTKARSLVDQGRDVDIYKDVDKEAVLEAGLGLASLNPVIRGLRMARPVVGAVAQSFRESLKDLKEGVPAQRFSAERDVDIPFEQAVNKVGAAQMARELKENTGVKDLPNTNPDKKYGQGEGFLGRTKDEFLDRKKGGLVKQYAKGGKINLAACGVSTHTPSKKNPNF